MRGRTCLLIAFLLAATVASQGCRPAAMEVSTATPVATERPAPTALLEDTQVPATEEPTAAPESTEPPPTSTATLEPEEPTATPEPEEPTSTPEATAEPAEPAGQVLLEDRCTVCHTLDRVEAAGKSREEWGATLDRMLGYGAQLSESEQAILLDYLVETHGP